MLFMKDIFIQFIEKLKWLYFLIKKSIRHDFFMVLKICKDLLNVEYFNLFEKFLPCFIVI